jgi:hypothetical protein
MPAPEPRWRGGLAWVIAIAILGLVLAMIAVAIVRMT